MPPRPPRFSKLRQAIGVGRRSAPGATGDPPDAAWYQHLVRINRAHISWADPVRVAASVVMPLAVGLVFGGLVGASRGLAAGVFASIGALVGAIAPQRGPWREKLSRTAAGVILGAAGLVIGRYAAGGGWQPVLLIAAVAAGAGLLSAVSANVSFGSLQLLIYIAVGSGLASSLPVGVRVGLFIAGGVWATLLTFLEARASRIDPDRAVVSDVLQAIEGLLAGAGSPPNPTRRTEVIETQNRAHDQVVKSRSLAPGRSPRLAYLAGVLNSTAQLADGAVALYRSGEPVDPADLHALEALTKAVRTGRSLLGQPPPAPMAGSPAAQAVREGIRVLWKVVGGELQPPPAGGRKRDWRAGLADLASQTVQSPDSWAFAVRLAVCMGIAEIVRQNLPTQRPYWVLLTVAIVLKPDFGSIFARGVQRAAGTVIGVLIGAAVLALVPHNGWTLIPMAMAAANIPWTQSANFGLFAVSLTPVIVILLDLAAPGASGLVTARLVDTLVGCGIVLIFGYLLWPQTWQSSLDKPLQRVVAALDAYVGTAFTLGPQERRPARRRTFRELAALQTQLQRELAEPPPISTRAASWWPIIVQLERTADSVTEARVEVDSGAAPPPPEQIATVRQIIRQLGEHGTDSCPPLVSTVTNSMLASIAREANAAGRLLHATATGPHRISTIS